MTESFNQIPVARKYRLTGVQKIVAERLKEGQHAAAAVTTMAEVPAAPLMALQQTWRARGLDASPTHLVMLAAARCLERYPTLNGTLHDGWVHEFGQINMTLAISMPNGDLQTVVIRDTNHKTLAEIVAETSDRVERARQGKLSLDDVRGGTFMLSSYGSLRHIVWATPIISPGQAGVLGIGRIRPGVVVDETVDAGGRIASILPLSLTYDHRIINGVPAGSFLEDLAAILSTDFTEISHE